MAVLARRFLRSETIINPEEDGSLIGVQIRREVETNIYTLKDGPIFSCVRLKPMVMLDRLG